MRTEIHYKTTVATYSSGNFRKYYKIRYQIDYPGSTSSFRLPNLIQPPVALFGAVVSNSPRDFPQLAEISFMSEKPPWGCFSWKLS